MLPEEVTVQITWRSVDHIPVLDLSGRFVVWTDPAVSETDGRVTDAVPLVTFAPAWTVIVPPP